MSAASFNLNEFLSSVRTKGLARVNRFEVQIIPPAALRGFVAGQGERSSDEEAKLSSLFCEISNFPPLNLSVKPFKIFGPTYQRPITSEYGGDGMSMTFHIDREMMLKRFFDDWLENVVTRDDFTVNYQEKYITTINIKQLDEENNITYEIELLEAFPRSMTLVDLNNSAQNQTHRLNIIFAYRYWRRTDIVKQPIPVVPLSVVPVFVPPDRTGVSWDINNDLGGQVVGGSDFAVSP